MCDALGILNAYRTCVIFHMCFSGEIFLFIHKYSVKHMQAGSSYNKFAPHKNEQWVDFSMQLARTTGGRLNDYVTTTALRLSENNNQAGGGILQLSEIKGEWE